MFIYIYNYLTKKYNGHLTILKKKTPFYIVFNILYSFFILLSQLMRSSLLLFILFFNLSFFNFFFTSVLNIYIFNYIAVCYFFLFLHVSIYFLLVEYKPSPNSFFFKLFIRIKLYFTFFKNKNFLMKHNILYRLKLKLFYFYHDFLSINFRSFKLKFLTNESRLKFRSRFKHK